MSAGYTRQEVIDRLAAIEQMIESEQQALRETCRARGCHVPTDAAEEEGQDLCFHCGHTYTVKQISLGGIGTCAAAQIERTEQAAYVEEAMRVAILTAADEGVSILDSDAMKRRIDTARIKAQKELGLA